MANEESPEEEYKQGEPLANVIENLAREVPEEEPLEERLRKPEDALRELLKQAARTKAQQELGKAIYAAISSSELYDKAIANAPSQEVWEQLYLPELSKEGGVLTKQRLMKRAAEIIKESIENVTINDILKLLGSKIYKELKPEYDGKYVSELPEELKAEVIDTYVSYMVHSQVSEFRRKQSEASAAELMRMVGKNPDQQ